MEKTIVGVYPRVSSHEQATEGYSIGEQIDRLTKYCEAMGWEIYKIYTDPGYSGGNIDRPGLQEMIKDVHAGKVDKVVVYKLDRLSRSQKDTMFLIEDEFLAHGVDFVSMSENFDTSTPFGRAMIGILAVFAQLERENIKERTMIGKEARAKEGKWHGSKFTPIGYDYIPLEDKLVVNEYEAMQVRELYELFLAGTPIRTIETMFYQKGYKHKSGYWSTWTIRNVLKNKHYIGYLKYNDTYYPGDHEAIIDEDSYYKAVKILKDRVESYKEKGYQIGGVQITYLGGFLYCSHCGGRYVRQKGKSWKGKPAPEYYSCYSRNKSVKKMIKDPNCKNKNWRKLELEKIIFDEIKKLAIDPDYFHEIRKEKSERSEEIKKVEIIESEIKKIDDQISRFMDLYGIGKFTIDQVSAKVDPLNELRTALTEELKKISIDSDTLSEEETIEIVKSFGDILDRGDINEVRLTIESLIDRIEIDNDDVTIYWKFA